MVLFRCIFSSVCFLALFSAALGAQSGRTPPAPSMYYVGGNASMNLRLAAYEFDAAEYRQDTARTNLLLFGFSLGKRYGITSQVRLKIGMIFNFGSALDDTINAGKNNLYPVKRTFFQIGLDPELQFAFPSSQGVRPYLLAGGGFNFVRFREGFFLLDDLRQQVEFSPENDMNPRLENRWCPHAHAGAGFDYMVRREFGISVQYSFRFWKPVAFDESRDLPVSPVPYREYFLSHMIQVILLLGIDE